MGWYAVVDTTGELVSVGSSVADDLPEGVEVVELDTEPKLDGSEVWNATTRTYVTNPDPPMPADDRPGDQRVADDPDFAALSAPHRAIVTLLARHIGR